MKDAQLILVIALVHEMIQQVEHLALVGGLIHGQEVVANVACIYFELFWALGVRILLIIELLREPHFHYKPSNRDVICDVAQSV